MLMNIAPPLPGECTYPGTFGNFCHRPGIPEQGGRCFLHSGLPKTREQIVENRLLEGVVIRDMDLTDLDLHRAWMRGFTAIRCDFSRSNLESAMMQGATFDGCNFIQANLRNINALGARFTNCILFGADLTEANLLSANLTNSSFQDANMQGASLSFGGVIIYPGMGNPKQYYTQITGVDFDGADFTNINLDPIYKNEPNMQEPLRRVWLRKVKEQLERATSHPQSNAEKKESLEMLAESILERIPGLEVHARDKRLTTSEVDRIVKNRSLTLATSGLGGPIFVECRNVEKPVDAKSVRDFAGKLPPDGVGIVITTNRLTEDAEREMKIQIQQNVNRRVRLLFWDSSDLEKIANGEVTPEDSFIERYYYVLSL